MTPAHPLHRVWLVINAGSGSTDANLAAALTDALAARGVVVTGTCDFPDDAPPDKPRLVAADVDTLMICGGDGTINAAWAAADDWPGQCLVLPGGTMNGLARTLHGDAAWADILSALGGATLARMPFAEAQGNAALVGAILGPAAAWVHAREGVRKGRFGKAIRAARLAWARSFGRSVRVAGASGRHRAVVVTPLDDHLEVATIGAEGVADAMALGWQWLRGDWRAAAKVGTGTAAEVTLSGRHRVRALFDGEPVMLASPACVRHGRTRLKFVRTLV